MAKRIIKGAEVLESVLSGVKQMAETVVITLGPKGRNVGIEKKWISGTILHDGVSVAKEIELEDKNENFAAQLIRQVSEKTNDKAGDGTTTSMLLAWKIIEKAKEYIDGYANPMVMKKGMEQAVVDTIAKLKEYARPVKNDKEIENVAIISCADQELGKIISGAIKSVGLDGTVSVSESYSNVTTIEKKEGMQFDGGFISRVFTTNETQDEADIQAPFILLADSTISDAQALSAFLKKFVSDKDRREIVIIAPDIIGNALDTLAVNIGRANGLIPLPIKAPLFAEKQREMLEDLAVLTGATLISKSKSMKLEEVEVDQLGFAERVISDEHTTKIVGGAGKKEDIKKRVDFLKKKMEDETSEFEKQNLRERIAKLVAGAVNIKVGATTEIELKEKKERVIDAVEAVRSAMEEGIVVGGGKVLYTISKEIEAPEESRDYVYGYDVVKETLKEPLYMLIENSGLSRKEVLEKIDTLPKDHGIDVLTEKYGDLFEMGVIDPVKVTRNAVANAVSVASTLITMGAIVTEIEKEKEDKENLA